METNLFKGTIKNVYHKGDKWLKSVLAMLGLTNIACKSDKNVNEWTLNPRVNPIMGKYFEVNRGGSCWFSVFGYKVC